MSNLKIISAGAGSGKTYRLTQELVSLLKSGTVRANGIIATTFTNKAAAELQERVRVKLLEEGLTEKANELTNALIGTVHGLGVKLLRRFAFEAGVSPQVDIIADEDQQAFFNLALTTVLPFERIELLENLSKTLGLDTADGFDFRKEIKKICDIVRANDFDSEVIQKSKELSYSSFLPFLGEASDQDAAFFNQKLKHLLDSTMQIVDDNEDQTATTAKAMALLQEFRNELDHRENLSWHQWVKISKTKVGKKSKDDVEELMEFAKTHERHPLFRKDIKDYIYTVFDIVEDALSEYQNYKSERGLIDYIDMESLVNQLLKQEAVQAILGTELDLLMVDEFQDTSPLQLEIFYKLSQLANQSIWVGDPKQSIYGFRGAEPRIMLEIIKQNGGVKAENIQERSWRSREDIVFATNAIFSQAFPEMAANRQVKTMPDGTSVEVDQVALIPQRAAADQIASKASPEYPEAAYALLHWHFMYEGKRPPSIKVKQHAIAKTIKDSLERGIWIDPKEEEGMRLAKPGDIAILCRTNGSCAQFAEALHHQGLKAAISRVGLLQTAEAKLILACLKYMLHRSDSLSVAEILLLTGHSKVNGIIEDRLEFLQHHQPNDWKWGQSAPIIQALNKLREEIVELSSAELLDLLLENLDLRRYILRWGKADQRLSNIDMLRKMALQYEEKCNRLHTAASLGGFLLWLNELEQDKKDIQGSGENIEAVNVLTYHKSKGLEWPIVILADLEKNLRDNLWGANIIAEKEEVDLRNILGNRYIRYWVNPYGKQSQKTNLSERLDESAAKAATTLAAVEEEARLLYVGITRARDYLIFPTRQKETAWLNRVCNQGDGNSPALPLESETPWVWNQKTLVKHSQVFHYEKELPTVEIGLDQIQYFAEKEQKDSFQNYFIDLSIPCGNVYKGTQQHAYHAPLALGEFADSKIIAKAISTALNAWSTDWDLQSKQQLITSISTKLACEEDFETIRLIHQIEAFYKYCATNFASTKSRRFFPVSLEENGQFFESTLDLVLENDQEIILIQHSSFSGASKRMPAKIKELSPWIHYSQKALNQLFQKPIKVYIHFVLGAHLVELS